MADHNSFKLRLLHLSDLHERGSRERESWRRRRVLGENWLRNLDELKAAGPFDLVCFTGDAADWGLTEEYAAATEFFQETLRRLGVPPERFFLVPGNHDVCRKIAEDDWTTLRANLHRVNDQDLSRWLAWSGESTARPSRSSEGCILDASNVGHPRSPPPATLRQTVIWSPNIERLPPCPDISLHKRFGKYPKS